MKLLNVTLTTLIATALTLNAASATPKNEYHSIKASAIPVLTPSEKNAIMALVNQTKQSTSAALHSESGDWQGTVHYVKNLVNDRIKALFTDGVPEIRTEKEHVSQTVACENGGSVQVNGEASGKSQEISVNEAVFSANGQARVTAERCLRKTESDDWEEIENAQMVRRQIDGTIRATATIEGRAYASGGYRNGEAMKSKKAFNFELNVDLDGSLVTASIDLKSGKRSRHVVTLKNFGVSFELSDRKIDEYRLIQWDPFGAEAVRAHEIEYFQDLLKCRGEIVLDEREYSCDSLMNFVIEQMLGK